MTKKCLLMIMEVILLVPLSPIVTVHATQVAFSDTHDIIEQGDGSGMMITAYHMKRIVPADLVGGSSENHTITSPGAASEINNSARNNDNITLAAAEDSSLKEDLIDDDFSTIADPLEPVNRVFFHINDKLYFWLLKPVATGYRAIVPEVARVSVNNFFENLTFPIRFVNCLFQAKFEGAEIEFTRFMVNTFVGMAGFFDQATTRYGIQRADEDLGQTLGTYGMGPAFYINWPIFGPSSLRDTFGMLGDGFLDPINYVGSRSRYRIALKGYKTVNKTSLILGDYEDLKAAALDPYISVRDAYFQHRESKIKE